MKQELIKQKMNFAQFSRTVLWLGLIVCVGLTAAARAQVIPTVCFESKPETLTRTLANPVAEGAVIVTPEVTQVVPFGFYRVVFNPNTPTEESFPIGYIIIQGRGLKLSAGVNISPPPLRFPHERGETVLLISDGQAAFGYNNLSSTAVTILRSLSSVTPNYFFDGTVIYATQPSLFQPGIHENIVSISVVSGYKLTWLLLDRQAISTASADQGCAKITYQGRLSDGNAAANGQFDLQFQAFETATGGIAQSELITLQDVQVTNGIFTVPLFFGSTFSNNFKARFLEIGVRAGTATGAFTTLTPRQPITQVPYAVNAQTAQTATTVVGATNLSNANSIVQRDASGNFTAGAITATTFNGNLNGTATNATNATNSVNATNATNAINATNAAQLGGIPAANYLTNTSNFGQSATTASGTGSLSVTNAITAYTLVPGLTQTVNVPANSSLLISTDGGIFSQGAINTFSVVDVAIFVDGAAISIRRIVVSNSAVAASVDNWALSMVQTLSPGNRLIEVKVIYGNGQPAFVSDGGNILLRGRLTVVVIKN